jgi:hypothetical protein
VVDVGDDGDISDTFLHAFSPHGMFCDDMAKPAP